MLVPLQEVLTVKAQKVTKQICLFLFSPYCKHLTDKAQHISRRFVAWQINNFKLPSFHITNENTISTCDGIDKYSFNLDFKGVLSSTPQVSVTVMGGWTLIKHRVHIYTFASTI
jgi:hypothetical protein